MSANAEREAEALERIVRSVAASRKYAGVVEGVVRRAASRALEAGVSEREALARTRRKLHQLTGAFIDPVLHRRIEAILGSLEQCPRGPAEAWTDALREASLGILALHASTAERIAECEELYRAIYAGFGAAPLRVLDLGCGLNPFALPWMRLPPGTEYHAVDLDRRIIGFVDRYHRLRAQPGSAVAGDVLGGGLPPGKWDVVLLLKLLPTLEREEPGSPERLIRSLDATLFAVSYPRTSLGGRRKGMDEHYEAELAETASRCGLVTGTRVFRSEMLYLCRRKAASPIDRGPVG